MTSRWNMRVWVADLWEHFSVDDISFCHEGKRYEEPWVSFVKQYDSYHTTLQTGSRVVLQSFIGKLDKNGNKIYEGDIVRHIEDEERNIKPLIGEVVWCSPEFYIKERQTGIMRWVDPLPEQEDREMHFYGFDGPEFAWESLEVVGNVNENNQEWPEEIVLGGT